MDTTKSIEDQAHQIFSDILETSRKSVSFSFEEISYLPARGPYKLNEKGEKVFYLDGSAGLLGFRHPVVIKSQLKTLLNPESFCTESELQGLFKAMEDFLFKATGIPLFIGPLLKDQDNASLVGYYPTFFSNEIIKKLKLGQSFNITNFFPFQFSVSTEKINWSFGLHKSSLIYSQDVIRFLHLGDFYGENGLITRKSDSIYNHLKNSASPNERGLIFTLINKLDNPRIVTNDNNLVFPLSFDESVIKEVLTLMA